MSAVLGPESRPTLSFKHETELSSKTSRLHGRILDTTLFPVFLRNAIVHI